MISVLLALLSAGAAGALIRESANSIAAFKRSFLPSESVVLLGNSNFDKIVECNGVFIDKTLFIKEFVKCKKEVSVILRPRRFGKSSNLSMLNSFLSINPTSDAKEIRSFFDRCRIGEDLDFMSRNFRQHPVIWLNLKDCAGNSWQEMFNNLWICVRDMYLPHLEQLSDAPALRQFDFHSGTAPSSTLVQWSLKLLTEMLYFKHGRKRVIVLVDEYDAPLNCAFRKGFYDEASSFFGIFFSRALKDNNYLKQACLMGIVEVRGAEILSTLNNIHVCSVDKVDFSEHFGFSVQEVSVFFEDKNDNRIASVLEWYDGYVIGSTTVINPWSFLNFIEL